MQVVITYKLMVSSDGVFLQKGNMYVCILFMMFLVSCIDNVHLLCMCVCVCVCVGGGVVCVFVCCVCWDDNACLYVLVMCICDGVCVCVCASVCVCACCIECCLLCVAQAMSPGSMSTLQCGYSTNLWLWSRKVGHCHYPFFTAARNISSGFHLYNMCIIWRFTRLNSLEQELGRFSAPLSFLLARSSV